MKPPFLALAAFLALNTAASADPAVSASSGDSAHAKMPPAASDKAWSVTGPWFCMHSKWQGLLTLAPDGTILNGGDRLQGQWLLNSQGGQMHLLIRWREWPAVDLAMLNANEFYGEDGTNELRLRRQDPASASGEGRKEPGGPVETRSWHQGEPAVKLIRQDEGFCALTSVTGQFQGNGEMVKVYVAQDGYWYLGGRSAQHDVAAECIVIRYRGAVPSVAEASGEEEPQEPLTPSK